MDSSLVKELIDAFSALRASCDSVATSIRADTALPLCLPTYSGPTGGECEAAIRSLTQLWKTTAGESLVEAGMLCASVKTLKRVTQLNRDKQAFQDTVKRVRRYSTGLDKTRLDLMIERVLKVEGQRNEPLRNALTTARLTGLDLLRCYAQIRILPEQLLSLSWTWAKTHASIVRVRHEEAIEMARELNNPKARETALTLLSQLSPNEALAYKKKLPHQLRANLVWEENGEHRRKAVTISGVVIVQDPGLPRYVWRDNPDLLDAPSPPMRLSRIDAAIAPEPYIKSLHLHRYLAR